MKYVKHFKTESDFNTERQNYYIEPWTSVTDGRGLDYNKNYTKIPFTIEVLGSGNITWALGDKTVQYSKNGGSWGTMTKNTTISVVEGDEVQFKGTNTNYSENTISSTSQFNVKGNIMSLTDGDNFKTADTVNASGFHSLFKNCTYLVSAGDLKLPATTLADNCYTRMFQGCTSLTTTPELPAMTLANSCYYNMFRECTSLITTPELPAMTLANSCYREMFAACSNLTTAPELPATTLVDSCYIFMFYYCTSLTTAPELPATTLVNNCYRFMFGNCSRLNYIKAMFTTTPSTTYTFSWVDGVAASGTFVKNSAAQWNVSGTNGIPSGWTIQTASE